MFYIVWLGRVMVMVSQADSTPGRRFRAATLAKSFTHMCLCHPAV